MANIEFTDEESPFPPLERKIETYGHEYFNQRFPLLIVNSFYPIRIQSSCALFRGK